MLEGDDVLAQPTRARLFALLAQLRRAARTTELAERLRLHPNGVRIHLERLEQAGLVARAQVRGGRGRPPDAWMIAADARPGGRPPDGYRDLGRWLARALGEQAAGARSVEEIGRQIGRELTLPDVGRGVDAFTASLSALGFAPTMERGDSGRVSFCLHNCPYADAVRENQPAVCALHRGMTLGLVDVVEPEAELADFVPHDPDEGGCVIELRRAWPRPSDRKPTATD